MTELLSLLNRKHRLTGGLATLKVTVGSRSLGQRIGLVDRDLHHAALHHPEELTRRGEQVLTRRRVVHQGRAGQNPRVAINAR